LETKPGQGKALTVLAHKLARAVYYLLQRNTAFDMEKFLQASRVGRVGEPNVELDLEGMSLEMVLRKNDRVALAHAHEHLGRAP
jgi:hypothetical protein